MTRLCSDRSGLSGFKRSLLLCAKILLAVPCLGHSAWAADSSPQQGTSTLPNQAKAADDINITNAWAQSVKNVPNALAAYFTIENHGGAAHLLSNVSSPLCDNIQGYHSDQENSAAVTKLFTHLALPAGTTLVFPLGGYHLFCRNVKMVPKPGETIDFTFTFMGGSTKVVHFSMRPGTRSINTD